MQVISRVEKPSSSSSNITPKSLSDLMQTIAKLLENGKTSAHQMKIIANDNSNERLGFKVEDDHQHVFDHHSRVTLNALETCLSMLNSYDFDHQSDDKIISNKRNIDRINNDQFSDHDSSKSEVISDANVSENRGYKRRKIGQSKIVEATTLMDDGYAWRKYGQKNIHDTKYPRSYYRCTPKDEQSCKATKQVQQISENPTKYNIIYHGQHTCKNLYKTSSLTLDISPVENSSCLLSFDTKNYPASKHALNSSLFPPSAFLNTIHHHNHHSFGAHKQYSSSSDICQPSSSSDNCPPSSDICPPSSSSPPSSDICPPSSSSCDLTSTVLSSTPFSSDQSDVISPSDEIYSSTYTPYDMDEDAFISLFNLYQDFHPYLDGLF